MNPRDMRAALRSLPVLTGEAPAFDPHQSPAEPMSMFVEWFDAAVNAGVPEPRAMTQGDPERRHQRLLYTCSGTTWSKSLLWP
jgi:pyridoxine/pyridoxamine 5'-phosphate oxidase